jgi:hypothetical protein
MAQGDPWVALALNPLVTLGAVTLMGLGLASLAARLSGRPLWRPAGRRALPAWAKWALGLSVLANWVYLLVHGA